MMQCSGQEIDPKENSMHKVMDELKETTQTNFKWETAALKNADQKLSTGCQNQGTHSVIDFLKQHSIR